MSMKAMSRGTRGLQPALSAQRRQWTELSDNELAERLRLETQPPKVEYDTLAPTCVPTKHYQKSLLRLPIPKLEDTCRNYIKTVTPLLTAAELKQTEEVVKAFAAGEGPRLHDKLVAKDKLNKHTSYITDDWFDMYLSARAPLPLNFAPFLVFRQDPQAKRNTQAHRAAAFIHASLRFRQAWEENKLAPEVFHLNPSLTKKPWYERLASLAPSFMSAYVMMAGKGFPLDMSQFPRLFNSTRIPRPGKDELRSGDASRDHHIVVMYKGHPYKINVMEPVADVKRSASQATEFRPVSVEQIAARIRSVVMDTNEAQAEFPLGALTSDDRDRWASLRDELELSPQNREALRVIDSAVFVLCLDDDEVDFSSRDAITKMGRLFLHGDPKKSNRWWDKSFQLIVSKNGYVCCNFEHSWGDGVAVMRWANDVWHTAAEDIAPPVMVAPTEKPERVEVELSETVKEGVRKAVRRFQTDVDALKYDVSVYPELGKKGLKRLKVSPDAFMQQGFQLAYKKLYGETRSTYESASTSAFRGGRTEAIRAATVESKQFCDAMVDANTSTEERQRLLQAAMQAHQSVSKDALMGKGIDRHLFALRKIAERSGGDVPDIFQDRGYTVLNENIISTSTLYNDCLCMGGFGPVHPDGFGLGYSPAPGLLFLGATSYTQNCSDFTNAVWEAVDEMKWLLEKSHEAKGGASSA